MAAAREEADRVRHGYVGCEHLLLALLTDGDATAQDILADHGVRLPAARAAVAGVISSGADDGPRWNAADLLATLGVDLPAIQRQMRADYGPHAIDE
jgi:ATP-dependent Clp protease ATP-binding subunit ClpA